MKPIRRTVVFMIAAAALAFALVSIPAFTRLLTDWYWFAHLGFESVFLTMIKTRIVLGVVVAITTALFFYANLRFAQRGVSPNLVMSRGKGAPPLELLRLLRPASLVIAAGLGLMIGLAASSGWEMVLAFLNRTPFEVADPVFGRDVAYYVFTLPLLTQVFGLLSSITILTLLMVLPLYTLRRDIFRHGRRLHIEPSAQMHLAGLVALLFVIVALNMFLIRGPSLVYSTTGPLFGASYTDLAVRVPLYRVLGVTALLAAAVILWGGRTRYLTRNGVAAVVLFIAASVVGAIAAATMQKFAVLPNELVRETPQIQHHIAATRQAWGIDNVVVRDLSGEAGLTPDHIRANQGTMRNVRLWDRDPLLQTFRQLQEIRTYYDFTAVDDDRYWINGEYRQVLLSPRELNTASLPTRNFINERLTYTHGMGLTLSPVNQVTPEGLPFLFVKDLPPEATVSLKITRPELYFGEASSDYVFVNTGQREFDYPLGDSSAFTVYEGKGGVRVGSIWRKLLFSIRFATLDVLLTDLITNDSRVLYERRIMDRASKALPFLQWDRDPYIVITDEGRLKWILDAYTSTSRYPYSLPIGGGTNYMRNSVKVVIDAYDGDVQAFIADPNDPLVKTYAKIFPDIFAPLDDMPADVRAHVRYPSDLVRIQTSLYTTYHMDEPDVFYAREDQWEIPSSGDGAAGSDPWLRHIVMRLPGEPQEEYISMTPFTPRQKDNLAAWMVARSDGDAYGQLVVYRFPRQSLVFGPTQVVNRINQDTEISRQISLWDQRGSQVIRGNLLVIPVEGSLLFVQALYLRAEGGQIPELKRVIIAHQNRVVMEETFTAALGRLFGGGLGADTPPVAAAATAAGAPAAAPTTTVAGSSERLADLARQAADHYDRAVAAQRVGDWATYGNEMRRVGELLQQLRSLAGQS